MLKLIKTKTKRPNIYYRKYDILTTQPNSPGSPNSPESPDSLDSPESPDRYTRFQLKRGQVYYQPTQNFYCWNIKTEIKQPKFVSKENKSINFRPHSCSFPRSLVLSSAFSFELNFHNLSAPSRQVASGKSTKERTFLRKGIARLRFTDHSFARVINQYFLVFSINILFNIC